MRSAFARSSACARAAIVAPNAWAAEPNASARSRYVVAPTLGASASASASVRTSGKLDASLTLLHRLSHVQELAPPPRQKRVEAGARRRADGERTERMGRLDGRHELLA